MNPGVGDIGFPMREMAILFWKTLELAALESILLHVVDAPFHLTLVPWRVRLRGQDHDAVVPAERGHLRHQLGVEPVRVFHRGLQVVDDQRLRHAAKMLEGVLTSEVFCGLPVRDSL
jgi:hypothetical protein